MNSFKELAQEIAGKQVPWARTLMFTARCNLRCVHCYPYLPKDRELTSGELKKEMDSLAEAGGLFLAFTGGEPLLREDFWELSRYARRKNFNLILFSNGILINEAAAEQLKKLNFFEVRLGILGPEAALHDELTGSPGSFEKTMTALRLLKEKEVPVTLITTLMRQNSAEKENIEALVKSLGVKHRFTFITAPTNETCLLKESE